MVNVSSIVRDYNYCSLIFEAVSATYCHCLKIFIQLKYWHNRNIFFRESLMIMQPNTCEFRHALHHHLSR